MKTAQFSKEQARDSGVTQAVTSSASPDRAGSQTHICLHPGPILSSRQAQRSLVLFLHQAWQRDQLSGMAENGSLWPLLLFFLTKSSACHKGLPFPGPCPCFMFVYNCQYACTDNGTQCSYLKACIGSFPPGMPRPSPIPDQPCPAYESDTHCPSRLSSRPPPSSVPLSTCASVPSTLSWCQLTSALQGTVPSQTVCHWALCPSSSDLGDPRCGLRDLRKEHGSQGSHGPPIIPCPPSYLVRPVLLMDMKDMDPEPVPLLKGSFAEIAGEFPVALVHTGGVLQMLISVIFVGKYFPTSFTSVAFCSLCQTQGYE